MTSASTVGLPRLSRISRAMIRSIVAVMVCSRPSALGPRPRCREPRSESCSFLALAFRCNRCLSRLNAIQSFHLVRHSGPDDLHETRAVFVRVALGWNRIEEMYMHFPRADVERSLGHDFTRAIENRWNDRRLRRDGEDERS